MGQEIDTVEFTGEDFTRFAKGLKRETERLAERIRQGEMSDRGPVAGLELEAWLVDRAFAPAPVNERFMKIMNDPLVVPELAQFNVEINNRPRPLLGKTLSEMERELESTWARGAKAAAECDAYLLSIGILPTLEARHLNMDCISPMNRYYALNEQVLRSREGRALRLNIVGKQHLRSEHGSVMLEAAGTSLQIHLQTPIRHVHRLYNAALAISAPIVAAGANSPYLFGMDLWDESRIPLFEQSVEVGGYGGASQGPLRRVGLGSGYVRASITECFEENLQHFPVLLPMRFDGDVEEFNHLRLHNGTVWRWNRPLLGFDADGAPHVRIEHRVLPGSPSMVDAIANAALFYGLAETVYAEAEDFEKRLSFSEVRDNFYQAARYGLDAHVVWLDEHKSGVRSLLLERLLPMAHRGLRALGIEPVECDHYLGIVEQRVENGQNGCCWQRRFMRERGASLKNMTAAYLERQRTNTPVHEWTL